MTQSKPKSDSFFILASGFGERDVFVLPGLLGQEEGNRSVMRTEPEKQASRVNRLIKTKSCGYFSSSWIQPCLEPAIHNAPILKLFLSLDYFELVGFLQLAAK